MTETLRPKRALPVRPGFEADAEHGLVRANLDVHLALADEAWWVMPQVCAKTGEPTTTTLAYTPSAAPKWAYLAFLLGALPGYLIVHSAFAHPRIKVPLARHLKQRRRLTAIFSVPLFASGIPIVIAGAADPNVAAAAIGAVLVAGAVALVVSAVRAGIKVRIRGTDVVLSRAHPAFAAGLAAQPTPDEQRNAFVNTSGEGRAAQVPSQIKRWNWGAFLFGGIWAIGNTVWIGLIGFVPPLNIVVGIKANEWAWRKKRWDTVENLMQTQRYWSGAAAAVVAGTVVLSLIYAFAGYEPVSTPAGYGKTTTAIEDYTDGKGGAKAGAGYGFVATFPSTPRHDAVTREADGFDLHIDLLTSETEDMAFQVGVVTYPDAVDVSNPLAMLHGAANGSAGAIIPGGRLVRYSETTVSGDPAVGVLISGSNGMHGRQRYVLHGHRLFTIQVISTSETPPGFGRFVASFRVLDDAATRGAPAA